MIITVNHPLGPAQTYELVEAYKDFNIVQDEGCIMVHDPQKETIFVVALDDSKKSGRRKFDKEYNTVEAAREHIDWIVKFRK